MVGHNMIIISWMYISMHILDYNEQYNMTMVGYTIM